MSEMIEVTIHPEEIDAAVRVEIEKGSRLPIDVLTRTFLCERLGREGIKFKPQGPMHLFYADPEIESPWEVEQRPDGRRTYRQRHSDRVSG